MSSYRAYAKYFFHMYRKSVILHQNLFSVKSKSWCLWKLLPFFVHVIGWNGARWKWLIFLYFLKLKLIFHSIRFRFIFVFRVIILLDEIFSSLFESFHFIIIKIVVDLFVFHHTKRGRWHVLRNIILSMIYSRASPVWCKSWAKKKRYFRILPEKP